jgi:hypothetical protein
LTVYTAASVTGATIVLVAAGEDPTVIQAGATHERLVLGVTDPVRAQDTRPTRHERDTINIGSGG